MPSPKELAAGLKAQEATSPNTKVMFVGQEHGKKTVLPDNVKKMAEKYGAYYEGAGGDKSDAVKYQGSWDDKASKEVKGYPKEFLYTLFTNSNVNNQKKNLTQPDKTIFDSALAAQDKWGYFKDRKFDADTLKQFLSASGMLDKSKQPATESNVKKFIDEGEGLMWPKNWEEYPNPAGKLAQKASEYRTNWLKSQKEGVYFVGSDHMKELNKPKEPAPSQLAKALAYQGEIRNTSRNRLLGGVADVLSPVSEFADQYKISDRIPFLGGMSAADLTGLKGAQSLVNDMSYGKSPISGASLQTAKVDPRVIDLAGVSGAMMPVGKALGKAALREGARQIETGTGIGRAALNPRSPITTWHGSPHTFPPTANNSLGEFSNENIGTGLGGQGYGRGHYVAEAPKVGEGYRNAGANSPEITYMGETYKASSPEGDLLREVHQMGKMNAIRKYPDQTDFIRGVKVNDIKFTGGNLYKVDLPDEHVAKMLEWDKPINEQSPYVLEALNKAGINTESSSIAGPMAIGQESHLAKHGITGIRYPDNPSIGTKEGTSNFVVFDPKHMNILERNGVGGAMMQRPKTEFEILHDTAQRNAALPKEQGGLGLPANNTYIDRANAPGMFPTDAYHATNVEFDSFDPSKTKFVNGVFSSTDPSGASAYVEAKNAGLPTKHEGGFVMPLRINNEKSVTPEYFNLNNIRSGLAEGNNVVGGDVVVIPDAKNIRSRFAAFDPMRRHEADILAGVGVGGMLDPQAIAEALRQQDRK